MNAEQAMRALKDIEYKPSFVFFVSGAPDFYLQIRFTDNQGQPHSGRKWRLSGYMTKSEVIQTALMAVLAVEEHEARELFKYKGISVFGPHISVDALLNAAQRLDVRA